MRQTELTQVGAGNSNPIPLDYDRNPFNVGFGCTVTGTVSDYTIEHTFDNIQAPGYVAASGRWFPHPAVVNQSSSQDGTYAFPVSAIRIKITTGTGSVLLQVKQAGHRGS